MTGKTTATKTTAAKKTRADSKKTTSLTRKTRAATSASMTGSSHEEAAYYNWLNRGAPLWDDQADWYAAS